MERTTDDDARMAAEHEQQLLEELARVKSADDLYCGHVDAQGLSWTRKHCPICKLLLLTHTEPNP